MIYSGVQNVIKNAQKIVQIKNANLTQVNVQLRDVLRGIGGSFSPKMPKQSSLLVINSARIITIPKNAKDVTFLLGNATKSKPDKQGVTQITTNVTQDANLAGKALTAIILKVPTVLAATIQQRRNVIVRAVKPRLGGAMLAMNPVQRIVKIANVIRKLVIVWLAKA
jgi:hypothetical protein